MKDPNKESDSEEEAPKEVAQNTSPVGSEDGEIVSPKAATKPKTDGPPRAAAEADDLQSSSASSSKTDSAL